METAALRVSLRVLNNIQTFIQLKKLNDSSTNRTNKVQYYATYFSV